MLKSVPSISAPTIPVKTENAYASPYATRNIGPRSGVAVQSLSPCAIGVMRFPGMGTDPRLFLLPSACPLLNA